MVTRNSHQRRGTDEPVPGHGGERPPVLAHCWHKPFSPD
jgi:hypothetical protein